MRTPSRRRAGAQAVAAMMKYNESLQKAGVLLALDGLHPPSMGARHLVAGGKPKVTDGPFTEAKEVVGGYWMIQVKSRRGDRMGVALPRLDNEVIEVRQVQESWISRRHSEAAAGFRGDAVGPGPEPARKKLAEKSCAACRYRAGSLDARGRTGNPKPEHNRPGEVSQCDS